MREHRQTRTMRKLFGTDGIRGVANTFPMTAEMAIKIGRATAYLFKNKKRKHRILVGRDTRLSGSMIESALVSGICSMGVDAIAAGHLPTPAVSFLTSDMRADAGIMISASHNPFQDNGIKIFSADGFKLPDEMEERIEVLICSKDLAKDLPTGGDMGKVLTIDNAEGRYMDHLKNTFPRKRTLEGMKIVVDCANGAAYKVAPKILEELGAEVISIADRPDGRNINLNCGAMHPEVISEAVRKHRADIGIALDGDADRAIFSDEKGSKMDGDHVMAICALDMKAKNLLRENTVVATVMSNMGFDIAMKEAGIRVLKTEVGDRYILKEMLRGGFNLGGEQSGHLIFLDHSTTGDGILSALQILSIMQEKGVRLSGLRSVMKTLPQIIVNVSVKKKKDLGKIPAVQRAIDEAEQKLKGRGRILVRYSGTQQICRVMIEGPSKKDVKDMANHIASLIAESLN
jgi:phosphoglucosamine mutase